MLRDLNALGGEYDEPAIVVPVKEPEITEKTGAHTPASDPIQETEKTVGAFGGPEETGPGSPTLEDEKTAGAFPKRPRPDPKPAPKPKKWPAILGGLAAVLALAAGLYFLPGWVPATCDTPETHKLLGITRGEALGHNWGEWTVVTEPGCTEEGLEQRICAKDPEHVETRPIAATGHNYTTATCTEPSVCTVCGEESAGAIGHDWGDVSYIWSSDNSSVTAKRTCLRCKEVEQETVNTRSSITKEATCDAQGETTYTTDGFKNSSYFVQTKTVDNLSALGHDWIAATRGETLGYEWSLGSLTWRFDRESGTLTILGEGPMTSIPGKNWSECKTNIKKIVIADGVSSIKSEAFSGCTQLQDVDIGDSVGIIGYGAFSGCASLEKLILPASLETIGSYTFTGCSNLNEITIHSRVKIIESNIFGNQTRALTITYDGTLEQWKQIEIGDAFGFWKLKTADQTIRNQFSLTGKWGEKIQIDQFEATPFVLDEPIDGSVMLSAAKNFTSEEDTIPYGNGIWCLYLQDLDGNWNRVYKCRITEQCFPIYTLPDGSKYALLDYDIPVSNPFKALLFVSDDGYDIGLWKPSFMITDEAYYSFGLDK